MYLRSLIRIPLLAILMLPAQSHAELRDGTYFQAISANDPIAKKLWYRVGSKKHAIAATSAMRSIDYPYAEGASIIFYGDRVDANAQPIPEAIATIPSGATRLLLRFTKLATPDKRGLSYRVHTFKDDTKTFPFSSFQFVNACAKDVAVDIGGKAFHLKQDAMKNIAMQPPEKGDVSIEITAIQSKSRYTNGWGHHSNLRTLVFIVDGPNGRIKPLRYRQTAPSN
jgi:hypothetical protein